MVSSASEVVSQTKSTNFLKCDSAHRPRSFKFSVHFSHYYIPITRSEYSWQIDLNPHSWRVGVWMNEWMNERTNQWMKASIKKKMPADIRPTEGKQRIPDHCSNHGKKTFKNVIPWNSYRGSSMLCSSKKKEQRGCGGRKELAGSKASNFNWKAEYKI